jgi:2-phospho-L-lactate guanylyltransferase
MGRAGGGHADGDSYTGAMHEPAPVPELTGAAVLVPVKAFRLAKARLATTLPAAERAALARRMADHVLDAATPLPTAVVCDDDEVARWAASRGAIVLVEPGRGLNGAVEAGVAQLEAAGATEIVVVHGDLPLAEGIARLAGHGGITLVPDHHDDGTTVVCLPAGAGFRFGYGPGSFRRHVAEAERLGLAMRVVREPGLRLDVDVPDDIAAAVALGQDT